METTLSDSKIERNWLVGNIDFKIKSDEQRTISGYASTKDLDRQKEVIVPGAFERTMPEFMKNPLLFYGHDTFSFMGPPGKPIGKILEYEIRSKGLWIIAQISQATAQAQEIWMLIKEGILRSFSIGFKPVKWEWDEEEKVRTYTDIDLYEISVVSIPANPMAVFEQARAKNITLKTLTLERKEEKMEDRIVLKDPENWQEMNKKFMDLRQDFEKDRKDRGDGTLMTAEERSRLDKMMDLATKLSQEFYAAQAKAIERKMPVDDEKKESTISYKTMMQMAVGTPASEYYHKVKKAQQLNDAIYIANMMLQEKADKDRKFRYAGREKLGFWPEYTSLVQDVAGIKSFDTATSTEGSQWIPTEFSAQFMDTLFQHYPLATYFETFTQPTPTFNWPIFSSDTEAKLIGETATAQTAFADSNEEQPTTAQAVFTAKKARATLIWSGEIQEDVSFDLISEIQRKAAKEIYLAMEAAIISGDDTATHFDTGAVPAATDFRKAYKGLRKLALANSAFVDNANAAWSTTLIVTALNKMGVTGLNPNDNTLILPMKLYYLALDFAATKGVDVFGQYATIVSGILQKIFGMNVLASGMYRQDLNGAGIFDNTTTTQSSFLIVNKPAWRIGVMRDLTMEVVRQAGFDQYRIYGWHRHSFGPISAFVAGALPMVYSYDVAQ